MVGTKWAAAVAVALAVAQVAPAFADAPRQSASLTYTTTTPSAVTGSVLSIDWVNPADPNAKPYAIKTLVVQFAPGGKIDTGAPGQCKASDAELEAQGASACPAGSKVASGTIVTDSGSDSGPFPRFINVAATNFNNDGEVIGVGDATNAPVIPGITRSVTRSKITGDSFSTDFPAFQTGSPPDGYNALKSLRVTVPPITRDGRSYGRTPPTCPASGSWTNTLTFIYQDRVTQTVMTNSPCTRAATRASRLKIRAHRVPRRGCAVRRIGVRVSVASSATLKAVVFTLDHHRLSTTRRRVTRLHLPMAHLRGGRHTLAVAVRDAGGNTAHKRIAFRRC